MSHIVRFVAQTIVAVIMVVVAQAGPRFLDEDAALALQSRRNQIAPILCL